MTLTTKSLSVLAAAALAAGLSGCGDSGSSSDTTQTTVNASSASVAPSTTTPSTSASASSGASSSGESDEAWAAKFKKVVPPLADKSDAEVVAAGQKVCSDWKANATPEGAKKLISDAEAAWKLDSVQANMWAGGAIAHFCNDQGDAFLEASIG